MLKVNDVIDLFNISDKLTTNEKGLIGIAVAKYRLNGEIIDFSGNERVCDLFDLIIRPVIDMEIDKAAGVSKARSVAGSKGGKSKAKRNNILNDKSKANVANVANANFAKQSVKAPQTLLERGSASSDDSSKYQDETQKNVVGNGGVNNINIYTTTTKDEVVTEIGGGGNINNTTTITITNSNEDSYPKKGSDAPMGSEFKLEETAKLVIGDITDNVILTRCSHSKEESVGEAEDDDFSGKCGGDSMQKSIASVITTTNPHPVTDNHRTSAENVVSSVANRITGSSEGGFLAGRENDKHSSSATGGEEFGKNDSSVLSLSERQQRSYRLLHDKGVWRDVALSYARKYDYERIDRNVKLKIEESNQGSNIRNLPAVIIKAIEADQAGDKLKQKQVKERPINKEVFDILNRMGSD